MTLQGADSAVARPGFYGGKKVWGIYIGGDTPHIWTHVEVAELRAHGVIGAMPIVVPPQKSPWWDGSTKTFIALAAAARAWGLKAGSPLCLDIEEAQAEAIGSNARNVEGHWAVTAHAYGYVPWTYGGQLWHNNVGPNSPALKWLAQWPSHTPVTPPPLPPGFHAWQYAGNLYGGRIDLDVFESGRTYYGTNGSPITIK